MSRFIFILSIFATLVLCNVPLIAHAADITIRSSATSVFLKDQVQVDVYLGSGSDSINAIEGTLTFPDTLLTFREARDADSIIPFWIEKPKVTTSGTLSFSGIIPGGYTGTGPIFSLIFEAERAGVATLLPKDIKILKNDGKGTLVATHIALVKITIANKTKKEPIVINLPKDSELPEPFTIALSKNSETFDGKWFIAFATEDKGTGIDHYEIQENTAREPDDILWKVSESPYVLSDQSLSHYVFVKAVDKTGNERLSTLLPQNLFARYKMLIIWIILIGALLLYVLRKYTRSR